MADCGITTKIRLVIAEAGVHVDPAVPVIPQSVGGLVKETVVGGGGKTAARAGFFHAVAHDTDVMGSDIGNIAVGHSERGSGIGCAIGGIPMTGSAIKGKGGG